MDESNDDLATHGRDLEPYDSTDTLAILVTGANAVLDRAAEYGCLGTDEAREEEQLRAAARRFLTDLFGSPEPQL